MDERLKMVEPTDFRELLLAYLLGELPADEREQVDSRLIADQEYSEAFKEAEYDLLDAYAAGELRGEQRERVYQALVQPGAAADSDNRPVPGNAEMAHALQRSLSAENRSHSPAEASAKVVAIRRTPGWRWRLAGMAAAVAVAVGLTLFMIRGTRRQQPPQSAQQQAPVSSHAPASSQVGDGTQETTRQIPETQVASRTPPANSEEVALILPETIRGSAGSAIESRLLPQTRLLRVEWPVAGLTGGETKTLQLQVASEQSIVITAKALQGTGKGKHGPVAVFLVPVKALDSGNYLFRVIGSDNSQVYLEASVNIER